MTPQELVEKAQKLFAKGFTIEKGAIDKTKRLLVGVVGSNGIIDRMGESINPMGWNLKNYLKNPVILFAHDYRSLPIGKAVKVWIENDQLMFTIELANTEMANKILDLFDGGFLNAFSVGFIPTKYGTDGNYTYAEAELLELSVVPVPANPEALMNNAEAVAKLKSIEDALPPKEKTEEEKIAEAKLAEEAKVKAEAREEMKALIREVVEDVIKGYKIVEEKIVEKIVEKEVAPKTNEEVTSFLRSLQKSLKRTDQETGSNLKLLKSLLGVTSVQS